MNSKISMIGLAVLCSLMAHSSYSQNVSLSRSNNGASNFDEMEAGGMKCRQGLTGPAQIEFGVGQQQENVYLDDAFGDNLDPQNKAAVFGKITYSFGMPKRMDCSKLYDLQIMILQEKLRRLQAVPE